MTAKKRSGGNNRQSVPKPAPLPQWAIWARYVTIALMGTVAFALVFPYCALVPLLMVPLMIGGAIGCWTKSVPASAAIGAFSGLAGSALGVNAYAIERFAQWTKTGLPAYAMQDTASQMLQFIADAQRTHPINTMSGSSATVILLSASATGIVAALVSLARAGAWDAVIKRWVPPVIAAALSICFVFTAWSGATSLRESIATEPQDLQYAYDPVINVKAYYRMRADEGFYDAYVGAIVNDSRTVENNRVRDGKITAGNPAMLRTPASFLLMRYVGASGANGIVVFSILWCAGILFGAFWAFRTSLASRALLLPMVLYPGLMIHTGWLNVFFPDWWACLALLTSALLVVGKRYWEGGVVALMAVLFREVLGAWLLVMIVAAVWATFRFDRGWWRKTTSYVAEMCVAIALFVLHYVKGRPHFDLTGEESQGFTVIELLAGRGAPAFEKVLAPTSYLMLPYGMYVFPMWLFIPAAIAGFWFGLPRRSFERLALAAYPLVMGAFYLIVGATSSYWGQHVMLFAVLGAGLLLARADKTAYELVTWTHGDS